MARIMMLIGALTLVLALAAGAVSFIVQRGFNGVAAFGLLILALIAFGVVGALTQRDPDQ